MMSYNTRTTTDHTKIRKWVEERKGRPACIKGVGEKGSTGILRIHFTGSAERGLEDIEWEAFFRKFDKEKLVFAYQEKRIDGELSRFNEISPILDPANELRT